MKPETFGRITLYNADCMDVMREMPDKAFDLAIVDPPYGFNFGTFNRTNKDSYGNRYKANKYVNGDWDKGIPTDEYWEQLFRITKNQIVWGGNYFPLPPCRGFVFWYKKNPVPNFSDGEFAWTSFNKPARCFDFRYYGNIQGNTNADPKIHPTQKPVTLYKWLLGNYAKPGDKILDTHLGSGSICIACDALGFDMTGIELDQDYYQAAQQRLINHQAQQKLF